MPPPTLRPTRTNVLEPKAVCVQVLNLFSWFVVVNPTTGLVDSVDCWRIVVMLCRHSSAAGNACVRVFDAATHSWTRWRCPAGRGVALSRASDVAGYHNSLRLRVLYGGHNLQTEDRADQHFYSSAKLRLAKRQSRKQFVRYLYCIMLVGLQILPDLYKSIYPPTSDPRTLGCKGPDPDLKDIGYVQILLLDNPMTRPL